MSLLGSWVSVETVSSEIKKVVKSFTYGAIIGGGLTYYGFRDSIEAKYEREFKERLQSVYEKNKDSLSTEQQIKTLEGLLR